MQLVNTKTKLKENNENCDKKWKLNGKLISHVVLLCELHKNQAKVERLSTTKTRLNTAHFFLGNFAPFFFIILHLFVAHLTLFFNWFWQH